MEIELDSIMNKILKHYLINKDFKWYKLFEQINNLTYQLPNIKSVNETNYELTTIMTFMEQQFNIPVLKINLIAWLKIKNENNLVFNIYTCLSDLRSW